VDNDFLKKLYDPLNPENPLKMADKNVLARVNGLIAKKKLKNRDGEILDTPVTEALIDSSGSHLYIVEHNIPILLPSKGIELEDLAD